MREKKFGASDIALIVVSILFLVGMLTVFAPCGPKEDGTWMNCHWAGVYVSVVAGLLVAASALHLALKGPKAKMALSGAIIVLAVVAAVIPNNIVSMCMMDTMRCHAIMTPGVFAMAVLTIAAAAFDLLRQRKRM